MAEEGYAENERAADLLTISCREGAVVETGQICQMNSKEIKRFNVTY